MIRHTALTLLASAGALVALSAAAPANATSPEPIPVVRDYSAATTWTTEATERAVADCMAAHGFTYIPFVQTVTGTPLVGAPHVTIFSLSGGTDPNEALVEELTVSERIAYNIAYWGPDTELDADGYMVPGPGNSIGDDACVQA